MFYYKLNILLVNCCLCKKINLAIKRGDKLNLFWHGSFLPPILHCVIRRDSDIPLKCGYFPLELCPKLLTWKISPRQVNRVVNKIRRRSSLLTTPTHDGRPVATVYYTSVDRNTLTPVTSICCGFAVQLCCPLCLQCFVAVGWAAGRASGL